MGKFIFAGEIDKLDTDGSLSKNLIFSCTKSSQVSKGKLINILKIVQLFLKAQVSQTILRAQISVKIMH